MLFKRILFFMCLFLIGLPLAGRAQDDKVIVPQLVWTTGLIEPTDDTVFYSVLMTSGDKGLSDVTVSAVLPQEAVFVKEFWKPEAATFIGEKDGIVTWSLKTVDANVVTGPFTFVASFADSASQDFAPPSDFKANVTSSTGTLENEIREGTLSSLTDTGSLTIKPDGMIDLTAVEDTGLWFYADNQAVTSDITLNFQRNIVNTEANLPEIAEETWWCGSVSVSSNADVSFATPVIMVVPLVRAATPGTVMPVFAQIEDGEWFLISPQDSITGTLTEDAEKTATAFARVASSGTHAYIVFNDVQFSSKPTTIAVGIDVTVRTTSVSIVSPRSVPPVSGATTMWLVEQWL